MIGLDQVAVAGIAAAIVTVVTALSAAAVKVIAALKERAAQAKDTGDKVEDGTLNIRKDLLEGFAKFDQRFVSLETKIDGHGKQIDKLTSNQSDLLDMIVEVDRKVAVLSPA